MTEPAPHPIPLDPRVTLTVKRRHFDAAVPGAAAPRDTVFMTGYTLDLTNNETVLRNYYLAVGIFTAHDRKELKHTIPRHVAHVHPGQTITVDIALPEREDFKTAYLVDFTISDTGGEPGAVLARFIPDYPLSFAGTTEDLPVPESRAFYLVTSLEVALVAIFWGAVIYYQYKGGLLLSLLGSGLFFAAGCWLMRAALTRTALCWVLALFWGFIAFSELGLAQAAGAIMLTALLHGWLRAPARAERRRAQQLRAEIARRP